MSNTFSKILSDPLYVFNPLRWNVTDVHDGFVHVCREGAAAGHASQAAPDSQVTKAAISRHGASGECSGF